MAFVLDSSTRNAPSEADSHAEEEEEEEEAAAGLGRAFDMVSLKAHLPQKRKGLSMHFSGKSRSFACLGDAKCVDDLEKPRPEIPEAKRRKYVERRRAVVVDLVPWRASPGASHCGPCVGV